MNLSNKYAPLQIQYDTQILSYIKDYLTQNGPIGNQMPNFHLTFFDGNPTGIGDIWFLDQSMGSNSSAGVWDYSRAYRNSYNGRCLEVNCIGSSQSLFWHNFNMPMDFTSLNSIQNNFATITRTGMYGPLHEQLNFVLNLRMENAGGSNPTGITMDFIFYNGAKYATATYNITSLFGVGWNKFCIPHLTGLTAYNGFVLPANDSQATPTDMKNITQIQMQLTLTTSNATDKNNLYIQDAWLALPQNTDDGGINTCSGAYYNNLFASSIFVSQYFGNDLNNGTSRLTPVATLEQAIFILQATGNTKTNITIIDSAIYKPVYPDGTDIGLPGVQGGFTGIAGYNGKWSNIIIQAEYLETPIISRVPGVCDKTRIGARLYYRNYFYETTGGSGTIRTVGVGKTYATIAAALSAASSGDCIEIYTGIYDLAAGGNGLILNKTITIQAAENQLVTILNSTGSTIFTTYTSATNSLYNLNFQGNGTGNDIGINVATGTTLIARDCTFTGLGTNTAGQGIAIYCNGQINIDIEACIFAGNNDYSSMIAENSGSYGTMKIKNNVCLMSSTSNSNFIYGSNAGSSGLKIYVNCNTITGSSNSNYSWAYLLRSTASGSGNQLSTYFLMNDTTCRFEINYSNNQQYDNVYIKGNYFHDNKILAYTAIFNSNITFTDALYTNNSAVKTQNYFINALFQIILGDDGSESTGKNIDIEKNYFKNLLNNTPAFVSGSNTNSLVADSIRFYINTGNSGLGYLKFNNNIINNCCSSQNFTNPTWYGQTPGNYNINMAVSFLRWNDTITVSFNNNVMVNNTVALSYINFNPIQTNPGLQNIYINNCVMQDNLTNWQLVTWSTIAYYVTGMVLFETIKGGNNSNYSIYGLINDGVLNDTNPNVTPGFIDTTNDNFGWFQDSIIEQYPARNYAAFAFNNLFIAAGFSAPGGTYYIDYNFLNFQGFVGTCTIASQQGQETNYTYVVNLKYCNIIGGLIGVLENAGPVNIYNCIIGDKQIINNRIGINSIGIRLNCPTQPLSSIITNCIMQNNNTALEINSALNASYNTIIKNNYGIASLFQGYYASQQYINQIVNLSNNIVMDNNIVDYYCMATTNYSFINNRYYDLLQPIDPDYLITQSETDLTSAPLLDNTYLFPALQCMGYFNQSPGFQASNGSTNGKINNIGARSRSDIIKTNLSYETYNFYYIGTVNANGDFYALENPQKIQTKFTPINPAGIKLVDGTYLSNPTGYITELILSWESPDKMAKISNALVAALQNIQQTFWIIGLSQNNGATWQYYKLDKDSALSLQQQYYIYDGAPYGNLSLHLLEIPNFNLNNYLLATI